MSEAVTGDGGAVGRRRWRGRVRRLVAGTVVVASAVLASAATTPSLDARLGAALSRPRSPTLDRVSGAVTDAGSLYGLAATTAVLAASGRRPLAVRAAVAGGAAWSVAQWAKHLLDRERPYELGIADRLVHPPAGSSWPSGHAAVAASLATALAPDLTPAGRAALVGVAGVVAATRVQLGVHHPSDVVAGAALGALVADVTGAVVARLLPDPAGG